MRILRHLVLLALAVSPATALAHHGIINFDMNKEVDVSGIVTRLQFLNPHSWLHFEVTGPDGRVTAWKCELRGASVLRRSGWSADMFTPGARIHVTGAPDRFEPHTCYLGTVVFETGMRIDRY